MKFKFFKILVVTTFFYSVLFLSVFALDIKFEFDGVESAVGPKGEVIATAYLDEIFKIKVSVSGGERNTGDVRINGIDKLDVQGTSRSTSISIVNSKFLSETIYVYDVKAKSQGAFDLGPAQVEHDGKVFKSNPEKLIFKVEEKKAGAVAQGSTNSGRAAFRESLNNSSDRYKLFCRLKTDKQDAVIGEPLLLSVNAYSWGSIYQIGMEPPSFPGFLIKELENIVRRQEEVDGQIYSVLEKQYVLVPVECGDKTIDPITINFNVPKGRTNRHNFFDEDFFPGFFGPNIETKRTKSDSLKLKINPLPSCNGSVDGVGEFKKFDAVVDKYEAVVNEPILLTLSVEGMGNLDQIVAPKLKLPNYFKAYDSKTDLKPDLSSAYPRGEKRFEYVVQVGRQGDLEIPSQDFNYFDIQTRSYQRLKTKPIKLSIKIPIDGHQDNKKHLLVERSMDNQNSSSGKDTTEYKQDIHFIEEDVSTVIQIGKSGKGLSLWFFLILLLLPLFLYFKKFFDSFICKLKEKLFSGYLTKKSLSRFKKDLEKIIVKEEASNLYQFFLDYLSARYDVSVGLVNEDWIEHKLLARGFGAEKINDFLNYLNQCAGLSFASDIKLDINNKKLLEKSKYWFFMLESDASN